MKLNLGCGYKYLEGYVNIDGYNDTVADMKMDLASLEFDDNRADEILAAQVIEHLGYFKAVFMLSECWRVLKPGGKLIIETPDIEKAFENFNDSERAEKERLMQWIYGLETTGMGHIFCFPEDLLHEMLSNAGFSNIETSEFLEADSHPAVRVTAVKESDSVAGSITAKLRKNLLKKHLFEFDNELISYEKDSVIEKCQQGLALYLEEEDSAHLFNLLKISAFAPDIIGEFFSLLEGLVPEKYIKAAARLRSSNLSLFIGNLILEYPVRPFMQQKAFDEYFNLAETAVAKALDGETTEYSDRGYFSLPLTAPSVFREEGYKHFFKGIKHFVKRDYNKAKEEFMFSLSCYRENMLAYFNLARVCVHLEALDDAKINYEYALALAREHNYDLYGKIEEELKALSAGPLKEGPLSAEYL